MIIIQENKIMTDNNNNNKLNTASDIPEENNSISESNNIIQSDRVYNIQNLKPYNKTDRILSKDEAKRRGSIGGKKSGEVRRERKTMRETILNMLSQELSPEKLEEMGVDTSTLNGDYTMQSAVIAAMLREAINGSEKAMQLLRDTIGEQPVIKSESVTEVITKEDTDLMDNLKKSLIS